MLYYLRFIIVYVLIDIGWAMDYIPQFRRGVYVKRRTTRGWRIRTSQFGCTTGLCEWAAHLDSKWGTGIYKEVTT